MIEDPIVEEVRRVRDEYARRFNYDLDAICGDLKEKERASEREVLSLPPKPARKSKTAEDMPGGTKIDGARLD